VDFLRLPLPEKVFFPGWHEFCSVGEEKRRMAMPEKKIVVVDDDATIRQTLYLILKKDYRVFLAKDSEEALRNFRHGKFDLLIADFKLPHLNGLEMIGRFRELGYKGQAILISAHPDMFTIDELTRYAVGHFFVKPLDLKALMRSIEYLLRDGEFPARTP